MKVIILHPTEELLLVNYQKELIKALFSEKRVIFAVCPLWIPLPRELMISENLKDIAKSIKEITFGNVFFDSKEISIPVQIKTETGLFTSKLTLVSIFKGADFSDKDKKNGLKIKEPVRQIKVFRLGLVQDQGPHAKSISKSVWCKLHHSAATVE